MLKVIGTTERAPYFGRVEHVLAFYHVSTPIEAYVRERAWRFRYGYAPSTITRIEEV